MLTLSAHTPTPCALVKGGAERQDSVAAALAALPPDIAFVFIHDCARPLVQVDQIVALHKIVRREHAVVLAHRVTDTIKQRRASARLRTLERDRLWAMETPQVFARDLLDRAYARVAKKKLRITDDAQAVEALDHPIALLENAEPNPKVTHPADLPYLEFLLAPKPVAPAVVDSSAPFPPAAS
jgi:2-C-methyl-D-erythritol 4-phosphate cytidylyltransferase